LPDKICIGLVGSESQPQSQLLSRHSLSGREVAELARLFVYDGYFNQGSSIWPDAALMSACKPLTRGQNHLLLENDEV
jgi:hypothetical protein